MLNSNSLVDRVSIILGTDSETILNLAYSARSQYTYVIINTNHKIRSLYIPSKSLKLIQELVIELALNQYEISEYAHAYVKRKSIKTNVTQHKDSVYFYQTDIVSFFPSITRGLIKKILSENDILSKMDIDFIVKVVCPFGRLDLGSTTSPILSNIVMKKFDEELASKLTRMSSTFIYTRYSDDITISSKEEFDFANIDRMVLRHLKEFNFRMNKNKTKFTKMKDKVKITGVYLHRNGDMSVGQNYKNKVKKLLYEVTQNKITDKNSDQILGLLSYIRDIEPRYYQKMIIKYSNEKTNILEAINNFNNRST